MFANWDRVRIAGDDRVWTIVQHSDQKYQVQLGLDAATIKWVTAEEMELVERAPKHVGPPGFVPERGFMD